MKQFAVKYTAIIVMIVMLLGDVSISAAVVEPTQPQYIGVSYIKPTVVISSQGTIICTDGITIKSGYSGSVTWELKSKQDGAWEKISTWADFGSGKLQLEAERYAARGYDYRLTATVKVYASGGNLVETVVKHSTIASY